MKTRFLVIAILALALRLPAQTNNWVRLALVPESGEATVISDVLAAQLSLNPQIHLLERSEIGRVYREQELSAGNRDYIKLGQILGADGLLLLETLKEDTNEFLSIRLVAVKTGILLSSERFHWRAGDMTDWAAGIVNHLEPLLPKLTVPEREAVPISVVNLRSAFQTPEERELERNLTLLAIDRLAQERQVFILERRAMQSLGEEKELEGVDENAFWEGSYLLEGTIDREGYSKDQVTLSARLVPPQGQAPLPIELSGSRTNLPGIILQLTSKLLDYAHVSPGATPWTPAAEAHQYGNEARWALRWGLYEAARSASESAWALGERTPALAALRIRAYSDSIWPIDEHNGNISIPAVPDPASLSLAIRALTLYCEDAPLVLTNAMTADLEWFQVGIKALETAAGSLDSYYHAFELRGGNEEALAELRDLTRRLIPLLDAQARLLKGTPQAFRDRGRLALIEWNEGGVWFDKPEDALPFYHEMVEAGTFPEDWPRIVGWSWEDRKRAPEVRKQFLRELAASTNPDVRLERLFLSVLRAPNDATGGLEAAESGLIAALWEQRTNVLTNPEKGSLIARTEQALRGKYGLYFYMPFDVEPFASFQRQMNTLAQTLRPSQTPTNDSRKLEKQAPPSQPAAQPEIVQFLPWKLAGDRARPGVRRPLQRLVFRNGKLWGMFFYQEGDWLLNPQTSMVSVDEETGQGEEIQFPGELGYPEPSFDATSDSLFVSLGKRLARYRIASKTWETMPLPTESGGSILALNGRVYVANSQLLLEVAPETHGVQILVSSRRQPPANELDSAWGSESRVFPGSGKRLGVQTASWVFLFDPDKRAWEKIALPVDGPVSVLAASFSSAGGTQLLYRSMQGPVTSRLRLVGFSASHPAPELLLEHQEGGYQPATGAGMLLGQPLWQWPEPFRMELPAFHVPNFFMEGDDLWALQPRKVAPLFGRPAEEPVAFSDARNATLFHFVRGLRQPLAVPLRFEREGQPVDPLVAHGALPGNAIWLVTDLGVVVSTGDSELGHWFIPKSVLDRRWEAFRKSAQAEAGLPATSRPISETNSHVR